MEKYKVSVTLTVEVESPDPFMAEEMARDAFGVGESCGVNIVESEVVVS